MPTVPTQYGRDREKYPNIQNLDVWQQLHFPSHPIAFNLDILDSVIVEVWAVSDMFFHEVVSTKSGAGVRVCVCLHVLEYVVCK